MPHLLREHRKQGAVDERDKRFMASRVTQVVDSHCSVAIAVVLCDMVRVIRNPHVTQTSSWYCSNLVNVGTLNGRNQRLRRAMVEEELSLL